MLAAIGLKLANGEFYSLVEENSEMTRRLILTTVHDNQQSVQIDLYKSSARTMADAFYIGSLVMENIKRRPKGEPSIEFVITSDMKGDITADAVELDNSANGEHQTLSVSLSSLNDDNGEYEIPDFELESGDPAAPVGLYEKTSETADYAERKKFPWIVVICAALLLTAIGLALWLFLFQNGGSLESVPGRIRRMIQGQQSEVAAAEQPLSSPVQPAVTPPPEPQPARQTPSSPPPTQATLPAQTLRPAAVQQTPPPVIRAPPQALVPSASPPRERSAAPVASYRVPSVIPREGAAYRVRYGDTLWDIAEAFYRNPWLYPRIARFNNIRNPDLIISGTTIRVPPRN